MDIEALRTFREVAQTRHFARAAENLCVTQAAVSARIAQLERRFGARLFTRQRNNIQLTSEGHKLQPHADAIIASWSRASAEVGHFEARQLVALGCLPSIGEIFVDGLLRNIHQQASDTLVQIEQFDSAALVSQVRSQSLHLGLIYEPPRTRDFAAEHIADLDLVLVSTTPGLTVNDELENYIYVDWGTSFGIAHDTGFATPPEYATRIATPRPALRLLLDVGGAAYLARRQVVSSLSDGRLHLVEGAPIIRRAIYLICSDAYSEDVKVQEITRTIHRCVTG